MPPLRLCPKILAVWFYVFSEFPENNENTVKPICLTIASEMIRVGIRAYVCVSQSVFYVYAPDADSIAYGLFREKPPKTQGFRGLFARGEIERGGAENRGCAVDGGILQ